MFAVMEIAIYRFFFSWIRQYPVRSIQRSIIVIHIHADAQIPVDNTCCGNAGTHDEAVTTFPFHKDDIFFDYIRGHFILYIDFNFISQKVGVASLELSSQ